MIEQMIDQWQEKVETPSVPPAGPTRPDCQHEPQEQLLGQHAAMERFFLGLKMEHSTRSHRSPADYEKATT